jgi:hypothetical protein
MTGYILKRRWLIISLSILITAIGIALMPAMKTDPDIRNYIPSRMESRINTDLIEDEFGVQEIIMILFQDSMILSRDNLLRIKAIDRDIKRLSSVESSISLFSTKHIRSEEGAMMVDPAINRIPDTSEEIERLKEELTANPLAMGLVVSSDFQMAAIAATINSSESEEITLARIDSVIVANPGSAAVVLGGLPYIRKGIMEDVRRDGIVLVPLALLIMLLFLWIAFREWRGMVIPFTVVAMSIAVSMGLAPLFGWKLSIISLIVPIMLVAVANDYGIHMIARYQEINWSFPELDFSSKMKKLTRSLRLPILFTGITTIAGVLGLLTHSIIPARHVAILTASGIAFAILLSLFMVPAWLSLIKGDHKQPRKQKRGALDKLLERTGDIVTRYPVRVLTISALASIVFALGIFMIKVDSNQENFFPKKHPVKVSSNMINKNFGGSQSISVMVTGDIKNPEILRMFDSWSTEVEKMEGVGHVYSISAVIKEMSKGLYNSDEAGYNSIPQTREGVSQLLEIYNMNGDPDDFERLVDYDYSKAHLMVRLNRPETETINRVLAKVDLLKQINGVEVVTGGYAYIMSQFSGKIVRGQVTSLIFALGIVFILLSLIFKSVKGGLVATTPILASVIFLLGFMGITGISLDPATALLSSIMIGVGVDYTIHFIFRYRDELKSNSYKSAVITTLKTTGRGIVFNAFSVMVGFSVLIFSGFTSIRFFGYLVLISIGVCLISAMFVVPALMLVFKPRFVEDGNLRIVRSRKPVVKIFKRAIFLIIITLLPISIYGVTELKSADNQKDPIKIMEASRDAMKVSTFEAVSLLTIRDNKGRVRERTNVTASKSYQDGTEKRIIKFLSPPDVKGTTILIYDHKEGEDEMWIYLPALNKTRRIVSSEKGKSFMGSEFSNSDMSSPPISDFNHKIVDENSTLGIIRIESTPISQEKEDEYGYSRKISTISTSDFTVSRIEFFDFDNHLFKLIEISDYIRLEGGRFLIGQMNAINYSNNRTSEIKMQEVSSGEDVRDDLFVVGNLGR